MTEKKSLSFSLLFLIPLPVAELIKAGKFRWEVYEQKELQFRIYGDSAVVVGVFEGKGTGARLVPETHTWAADPSASFSGTLRFTHVYIKRNGKWLLAALQNAVPYPPQPKQPGKRKCHGFAPQQTNVNSLSLPISGRDRW